MYVIHKWWGNIKEINNVICLETRKQSSVFDPREPSVLLSVTFISPTKPSHSTTALLLFYVTFCFTDITI